MVKPAALLLALAVLAESGLANGDIQRGREVYESTCIACHGADGEGVLPGVPDLAEKDGPLSKPDEVLMKHMIEGFQSADSPLAMPPNGGNPDLTEEDIRNVLEYLRSHWGQ